MNRRAVGATAVAVLGLVGCTHQRDSSETARSVVVHDLSALAPPTTADVAVHPPVPPARDVVAIAHAVPPSSQPADAPVRLLFTGDVLMHSPLWDQAISNGGGTPDFTPMFEGIQHVVEQADLAVCHMETPIAPPGEAWSTDPRYGVPAEVVDGLAATGFDHCSTASNHTFDRGVAGVDATIERFATVGMTQHGMAAVPSDNEPILLRVGGITIGHISATYGFDSGFRPPDEPWRTSLIEPQRLIEGARLARARGAQFVVLSLHWGSSGSHAASERQRDVAAEIAESGMVDLIVGHHAHVVQPIEQIGRMWVAFGLGNFISNMPTDHPVWDESTRDGIVLEVELRRGQATPSGVAISGLVARPIWVDEDAGWVVRDVAAARLDPSLTARIGPELDDSWRRTASVVGAFLPR
jgi:poly-gamma-glutamate synthesis protein (capsule biosynthesis protein)